MSPRRRGGVAGDTRRAVAAALLMAGAILAAGPAAGAGGGLRAQERALTLEEALKIAARHNPRYRRAVNQLDAAGPALRAAWGAFLPQLRLNAGTSLNLNRQLVSTDFFGNPIENPERRWQTTSGSSQSASLGLTFFEGGRRFHDLEAARARAAALERAAESELVLLRAAVKRQFFATLRAARHLKVEEDLLAARRKDLDMARGRFRLAGASRVEVLQAELAVRRQEQRIEEARGEYEKAVLALAGILGDPGLGGIRLAGEPPPAFDPAGLGTTALLRRALSGHPAIVRQEAEVRAAEAQVRAAGSARWPSLSLGVSFYQGTNARERAALFDPFPDESRYGSASLSLSMPLFSGFRNGQAAAEAEVAARNARETLRETRLAVAEEIRSRLIDLRAAYQGLRLSRRSLEIAEERLQLARELYLMGSRTFTELQQDIEAEVAARRDALDQQFRFLLAWVDLEESVGGSVEPPPGAGERPAAVSPVAPESGGPGRG